MRNLTATVLRNDAHVPAGHFARVAENEGVALYTVRLDAGDHLPDPQDVQAVVVLGGEMGAYDTKRFPYLRPEKQFLRDVVSLGTPVLGICLGCQLLADALGGSAFLADRPEYHLGPIDVLQRDPTVETLGGGPSFALHRDTWKLPPGATLVARTGEFNHAFRFGSALGIQSHPELTTETLAAWLATPEGEILASQVGSDTASISASFRNVETEAEWVAERFFSAWLDEARHEHSGE